jgi:hypothetical protein
VLIHRAKAVDGRITVPNGPSYAVLVLPQQNVMRPEVAESIRRLIQDGATVVGPKPDTSPSLAGYPHCDAAVQAIAADVWESVDGRNVTSRPFGKGMIHHGAGLAKVLGGLGVHPDVQVVSKAPLLCAVAGAGEIGIGNKGGIIFKHRSAPGREIYFLSNTTHRPVEFTASLRVAGRKPELWNANTGTITDALAFSQRDGRTHVPLRLDAAESIYVMLSESIATDVNGSHTSNAPDSEVVASLDGPWSVRFDGQGGPKETVFETLVDWAKHPDDSIKHYSGTAVYQTSFTLGPPANNPRTVLALGKVAVMASVVVNGREAGTLWTTPWEIDISDFITTGKNLVEIRVANTWNNRLVADAPKPQNDRLSHVSQPYDTTGKKPLLASGLIGPVRVMRER